MSLPPPPAMTKVKKFQPYKHDATKVINHNGERGYAVEYFKRRCVNKWFRSGGKYDDKTFQECLNEYMIVYF